MNPYLIPLIDLWLRAKERRAEAKRQRKAAKQKEPEMDLDMIERQLVRDEGLKLTPYYDSVGKLTIGVGRNLADNGIRENEAMFMLRQDVRQAIEECQTFPFFMKLNEPRQAVMVNLMFNIGMTRLLSFKKMLAALSKLDYNEAAAEMLNSLWAKQVGPRALRLSEQMLSGEWRN